MLSINSAACAIPAYFSNTQSEEFHCSFGGRTEEEKDLKQGFLVSYNYIIGNPPFVGARQMNKEQKEDVIRIFGEKWKNVGNLDYVCCWYMKAFRAMAIGKPKVAFVSTNSICQGEQVALLWPTLINKGVEIAFAYHSFKWNNNAKYNAAVIVVIIGLCKKGFAKHDLSTKYRYLGRANAGLKRKRKFFFAVRFRMFTN